MNNKVRKFNIGDKVIRINKEFYNNSYHNGLTNKNDNMFIRSSIVSDVYSYGSGHWKGDVFYIDKYKHQVDSIGDSCDYQAGEICEKDGIATSPYRSHKDVWYHVEKDADKIREVINECKEEFHKECEAARQEEIEKLEAEIFYAQKRLAALKKGDTFKYCKSTIKSEKGWNDSMDKIINEVLSK